MFAQRQGLFFSPPCPTGQETGAAQEAGKGHSWARGCNIPDGVTLCSAGNGGGKDKDEGGMFSYGLCLPKKRSGVLRPCLAGSSWTCACWWEMGNEFLIVPYLHVQLWFAYQTAFIPTHKFPLFCSANLLPQPARGKPLSDWVKT